MNHSLVISTIINSMANVKSYLELGIYEGETFEKIWPVVGQCTAVDIVDKRKMKFKGTFHLSATDDFFKNNLEKFDAIFIDADHNFEQVKKDLLNSMDVMNPHGIIFLHDTDPARKELIDPGYCGDSYKIIDWMNRVWPDVEHITLPICDPGLTIVRMRWSRRVNYYEL